jgi:hypothetical protein
MKSHLFLMDFLVLSLAAVMLVSACFLQSLPTVNAQATFAATELLGRPTDTSVMPCLL